MKLMSVIGCLVVLVAAMAIATPQSEQPTAATGTAGAATTEGPLQPVIYATPAAYQSATGKRLPAFEQAPSLATRVARGELPDIQSRLPEEPLVVEPSQEIGRYGGTLTMQHNGTLDTLEDTVREFPTHYSADWQTVVPNIFKSWDISADVNVYSFHLRPGMKWSDGAPFTVAAFMFWYDAVANNTSLHPSGISEIKAADGRHVRFEAVDDYTLRITSPDPNGILPLLFARFRPLPYLPQHFMSQYHPDYTPAATLNQRVRAAGFSAWNELFDSLRENAGSPETPTVAPWVTTNRFTEQVHVLVRNPYYWKVDTAGNQLPYTDGLHRNNIGGNVETALLNAIAGEIDVSYSDDVGGAENFSALMQRRESGGYQLVPATGFTNTRGVVFFNYSHPDAVLRNLFLDKRFRIALSLGMNREEMNELIYHGTYYVSQAAPVNGPPYHGESAAFKQYTEYDPARANQLLDELDLTWNADRTRRLRPDGRPLQLVLIVNSGRAVRVTIAEHAKQTWESELGLDVVVRPMGGSTFNEQMRGGRHELAMAGVNFGGRAPIMTALRNQPVPLSGTWPINPPWGAWVSTGGARGEEPPAPVKELYQLHQRFKAEPDAARRIEIEKRIFAIHNDNLYIIAALRQPSDLYQDEFHYFSDRVGNWTRPSPAEFYYSVPATWYIKG